MDKTDFSHFSFRSLHGKPVSGAEFRGKVLLVVNTASECGLTPQYQGLEALHRKLKDRGFSVLGFPSNDFGAQEPGSAAEIGAFCEKNYGVTFPLFEKAPVKGAAKQALYQFLTEAGPETTRGEITWNFEKFLIGRDGQILARFSPKTSPEDPALLTALEKAIG